VIRVLAVSPKIGPLGFIKAFRDVVVELQDRSDEASVNEAFEADADIPGVNVTFRPTIQTAIKSLWLTEQEAISLIASEGSSQNSEYISITINPNVVNGTGNYRFSPDITATVAMFLFSSPALTHANVGPYGGTNVQFTAHDGYLEFESWGSNLGDIISGSFAVQVSGVQITGTDSNGSYTSRTHTGAIIGDFNLEVIPTDTN
jgi:hypothetical protein